MSNEPRPAALRGHLPKHRLEALTDGVFAIAITLLVLELRLPGPEAVAAAGGLNGALLHLLPRFVAWVVSFFVLAIFWAGHHRLFDWVRSVDSKLVWINLLSLLCASFLPFGSGLVGEYTGAFVSHVIYASDLAALGLLSLWQLKHLESHPELCHEPIAPGFLRAARVRNVGVVATALLAIAIARFDPRFGTMAFMAMFVVARLSRRHEAPKAVVA